MKNLIKLKTILSFVVIVFVFSFNALCMHGSNSLDDGIEASQHPARKTITLHHEDGIWVHESVCPRTRESFKLRLFGYEEGIIEIIANIKANAVSQDFLSIDPKEISWNTELQAASAADEESYRRRAKKRFHRGQFTYADILLHKQKIDEADEVWREIFLKNKNIIIASTLGNPFALPTCFISPLMDYLEIKSWLKRMMNNIIITYHTANEGNKPSNKEIYWLKWGLEHGYFASHFSENRFYSHIDTSVCSYPLKKALFGSFLNDALHKELGIILVRSFGLKVEEGNDVPKTIIRGASVCVKMAAPNIPYLSTGVSMAVKTAERIVDERRKNEAINFREKCLLNIATEEQEPEYFSNAGVIIKLTNKQIKKKYDRYISSLPLDSLKQSAYKLSNDMISYLMKQKGQNSSLSNNEVANFLLQGVPQSFEKGVSQRLSF